jgi:hypothetical protein
MCGSLIKRIASWSVAGFELSFRRSTISRRRFGEFAITKYAIIKPMPRVLSISPNNACSLPEHASQMSMS